MSLIRAFCAILLLMTVAGCASKFRSYDGPEVTQVVVQKADRRMHLLHHGTVLRSFDIDLGFEPEGDKKVQGDGKTPEGAYVIDRRNPRSRFHLSIGVSYPNATDIAEAEALGKEPGGDIFIHGTPRKYLARGPDWTWGCIAVTNREMEDIYAMVQNGTPIFINP